VTQTQPEREKTWLEQLEDFLTDEFHYGLHRTITETVWGSDVMVGQWTDQLKFFACLRSQHDYLVATQSRPEHLRSHLQNLNFSGNYSSGGEVKKFLADQLPRNRQNILLLHSLRLLLENRDQKTVNLSLIVPIIRREIHQCLRLVFHHLSNGPHAKGLDDFADEITQYEWLPMSDMRHRLANNLVLWLEQQGVERGDIDDLNKLSKFWRTLSKFMHYHPKIDEPVDFKYGHLFTEWQKYGFCGSMIYEIDRLGTLVNLETLSHLSNFSAENQNVNQFQLSTEKRSKGGTRYQNLLALHYFLRQSVPTCPNTKKARFGSFLTGFSENTMRQQWSNIHSKKNENGVEWEADMKIVRGYFEEVGLSDVVGLIDEDLKD
jgi:hypothetical protein